MTRSRTCRPRSWALGAAHRLQEVTPQVCGDPVCLVASGDHRRVTECSQLRLDAIGRNSSAAAREASWSFPVAGGGPSSTRSAGRRFGGRRNPPGTPQWRSATSGSASSRARRAHRPHIAFWAESGVTRRDPVRDQGPEGSTRSPRRVHAGQTRPCSAALAEPEKVMVVCLTTCWLNFW